jgi:hypothetical protein
VALGDDALKEIRKTKYPKWLLDLSVCESISYLMW